MDVVSFGPLQTASIVWQPRPDAWTLTAICKATFVLRPMDPWLADDQDAPALVDEHWNDDEGRSLRAAGDLVPYKPRADVVVVGHAHAPRQQPVASLVARLVVGDLDKSIEVCRDRAWTKAGQLREGEGFVRMPLVYERAAGGPDTWNPVGVRADARPDARDLIAIPNLQQPGFRPSSPGERIEPVGFGPLAPTWPSRQRCLPRRTAGRFSHRDWHRTPLPEEIEGGYFNVAPPDQQLSLLRGSEHIMLENLHPEYPRLTTNLPGMVYFPRALVERGASVEELPLRCDTLTIDSDRGRCTLTWRGQLPLEHPSQPGQVSFSIVGAVPPRRGAALTLDASATRAARTTMPFAPSAASPPARSPAPATGLPFGAPPPPAPPPLVAPPSVQSAWASGDGPATALSVGQRAAGQPAVPLQAAPEAAPPQPAVPLQAAPREAIELLWFEPRSVARVRRVARWREILDALPEADADLGAPAFSGDPDEVEDRREIAEILASPAPTDVEGLGAALAAAVRARGTFAPPLELCAGELELSFDEQEALRATVAAAAPLAAGDERLKGAVDSARELVTSLDPLCPAAACEGATARIRDAVAQLKRAGALGYLEQQVERVLCMQRRYQRRVVLGGPHLRALLGARGAAPIPTYLPDETAARLPLFARFRVRLLAEVHFAVDAYETHPSALRVVAIGRAMTPGPRR